MLIFHKTAAHPFLPSRHDETAPEGPGCFSLHFPYQLHLLPGNRTVVDFLLTVSLPPRHRAVLRLKDSPRDALRLHAPPLSESSVSAEKKPPHTRAIDSLQLGPSARKIWSPPWRTSTLRNPSSCTGASPEWNCTSSPPGVDSSKETLGDPSNHRALPSACRSSSSP